MNAILLIEHLLPVKRQPGRIPGFVEIFEKCFLNTIGTTMQAVSEGETFVITGDIPAMWLRDSTAQVLYYVCFAGEAPGMARMIEGLIARQFRHILLHRRQNQPVYSKIEGFTIGDTVRRNWLGAHPMISSKRLL